MKALSLWQPHVLAIALGLKPWETRDWPCHYRGPLALHAARRPFADLDGWSQQARQRLRCALYPSLTDVERHTADLLMSSHLVYGAVLCIVDVTGCVRTSELRGKIPPEHEFWGDFSEGEKGGRYGFRLENVRVLPTPHFCRGMQGFFSVDLDGCADAPSPQLALPLHTPEQA